MHHLKAALLGSALTILAPSASAQGYQCPLMMPDEVTALEFAYGVQNWLYMFYSSMGEYSADAFSGFPNSTMMQSNGESLAANLATNMAGLQTQSQLGVEAIMELAGGMDLSSNCDYTYPPGLDASAMDFFMTAYFIEATLCGTFIGLADYVQNPGAAFLMARLSAEHGIHASYLGSYVNPTPFSADSMALTPAFTPDHVLMMGDGTATRPNVGYLGQWIPQGCLAVPEAPCGVDVMIGNLTASLSGGDMGSASATSAYSDAAATSTYGGETSLGSGYYTYPYAPAMSTGPYGAATSTDAYGYTSTPDLYGASTATDGYGASTATDGYGASTATDAYGAATSTVGYGLSTSIDLYGAASSTVYGIASPYPAVSTESAMSSTAGGYGYGNASYPAGTDAATSYSGPVATGNAAVGGAEVSGSMMAGFFGILLAALF